MKTDELKLDKLSDTSIEQEVALLDYFLAQVPYSKTNTVQIEVKNISKEIFLKSHNDWWGRILEIIERFERVGLLSNFQFEALGNSMAITIDYNDLPFNDYRNILLDEQKRRTNGNQTKLFCGIEDKTFHLDRDPKERPLSLSFDTNKTNLKIFDLLEILFKYWKDKYYNQQLNPLYQCSIDRNYITTQIKKYGYDEFDLNDTKNHLLRKFDTKPELKKHITFEWQDRDFKTILFGVKPYSSKQ